MAKIKGENLMIFLDDKSVAYATNHVLNIQAEFNEDDINKDDYDEDWGGGEIKRLQYTITTDNLYSLDGEGNLYSDLEYSMLSMQPFDIVFGRKLGNSTNVPTGGWHPTSGRVYSGKAVITKLDLNAQVGEYATFTAEFQGVGPLDVTYNYDLNNTGAPMGQGDTLSEGGEYYNIEAYDAAIRANQQIIEMADLEALNVNVGDIMRLNVRFFGGFNDRWNDFVKAKVLSINQADNELEVRWIDTMNRYTYIPTNLNIDYHDEQEYIQNGLTLTGENYKNLPTDTLVCVQTDNQSGVCYGVVNSNNGSNLQITVWYFYS